MFSYLLLNIVVSALAAGTVIFFYDRAHPRECIPVLPTSAAVVPGSDSINVSIISVTGVGTVANERMVIQNNGPQEVVLTGWYLTDNKGLVYTFPQLTLFPGVKVQVHTAAGKDSPSDLFWGRASPVWTSGELAALYDTHNIVRAFFRIP